MSSSSINLLEAGRSTGLGLPLSASGIHQLTIPAGLIQQKNAQITLKTAMGSERERPRVPVRGAYLHVPFCFHKCHYCDFYSIVDTNDRQGTFVDRLIIEMEAASGWVTEPLATIFVGGGTPTLLVTELWRRLLQALQATIPLAPDGEFTVEANPETVTDELITVLADGGVNRISIGAQSFNPLHLKTLERWHDPANVERSIEIARGAGIDNINLDLIFGVPGQTLGDWLGDLDAALALQPTHLSCYGLMYEPNTALTRRMQAGHITPLDQGLEAAMYEAAIDRLASAGFEHYEISNWARRSCGMDPAGGASRCRHNLLYWSNSNWLALGPSASGHIDGLRWKNTARLSEYLGASTPLPPITDVERVDVPTRAGEQFMLRLRLVEGLLSDEVEGLLARSGERERSRREALDRHCASGLLERRDGRLRLTRRGLLLANAVLVDLV